MSQWQALRDYIFSNYTVQRDRGEFVQLVFEFGDGRTQLAQVQYMTLQNGEEWARVESPIGSMSQLDLTSLLQATSGLVCGGLGCQEDLVTFRDSFPLANLNVNEFVAPLQLVVGTADNLERAFVGTDQF